MSRHFARPVTTRLRSGRCRHCMMQGGHFDAVITEWHLADVSALELAASLRRNPQSASARILVHPRSEPRDIARALDSGIDDFRQAIPPEELVARVNAALRRPASARWRHAAGRRWSIWTAPATR